MRQDLALPLHLRRLILVTLASSYRYHNFCPGERVMMIGTKSAVRGACRIYLAVGGFYNVTVDVTLFVLPYLFA